MSPITLSVDAAVLVALVQSLSLAVLPPKPKAPEWQNNLHAVLARAAELTQPEHAKALATLRSRVDAVKKGDAKKARGDLLLYLGVPMDREVKCTEVFAPMFFDATTGALRPPVKRLEDVPAAVEEACKPFAQLLKLF